jgi:protein-disulfide isomerase
VSILRSIVTASLSLSKGCISYCSKADCEKDDPSTSSGKRLILPISFIALIGAAPAAPNWVGTVMQAPNGAYVMGNPKAKVRLIEYLSYTCSHCAHFAEESKMPLRRDYVAKGLVAVEFRNAVRDQFDMTAALLARCGGAARFFGNSDAILASQATWLAKAQSFIDTNGARLQKLAPNEGLKVVARGVGLDAVMKARGFTPAQMDACLLNKPNQDRIVAMTNEAWTVAKINGTPSFKVNGVPLNGAGHWDVVEPAIKIALEAR